jgi:hypothetical protein
MALTTELDVRILQKCFELGPYDNLMRVTDLASAERAQAIEDAATGTHPLRRVGIPILDFDSLYLVVLFFL